MCKGRWARDDHRHDGHGGATLRHAVGDGMALYAAAWSISHDASSKLLTCCSGSYCSSAPHTNIQCFWSAMQVVHMWWLCMHAVCFVFDIHPFACLLQAEVQTNPLQNVVLLAIHWPY
jgi:hypothetical protein